MSHRISIGTVSTSSSFQDSSKVKLSYYCDFFYQYRKITDSLRDFVKSIFYYIMKIFLICACAVAPRVVIIILHVQTYKVDL